MNKEEILNNYIKLIDKGYCSDCNELNCIGNFPHKDIAKAICNLQQENKILRENAEHNDKVVDKVNWENKRLYELCMYALISSTKIYNHELAINTKQAFIQIIKENLQEDTFTIRNKIKRYWETGESNE